LPAPPMPTRAQTPRPPEFAGWKPTPRPRHQSQTWSNSGRCCQSQALVDVSGYNAPRTNVLLLKLGLSSMPQAVRTLLGNRHLWQRALMNHVRNVLHRGGQPAR
jgi:hypothetical protein